MVRDHEVSSLKVRASNPNAEAVRHDIGLLYAPLR
jgi:hypothetical protein